MKYYLAGPMTGLPKFNFPRFDEMCVWLRDKGYDVVSAHEIDHGETEETRGSKTYMSYVRASVQALSGCDCVIFMPGWNNSVGCMIEYKVAQLLDLKKLVIIPESPASRRMLKDLR